MGRAAWYTRRADAVIGRSGVGRGAVPAGRGPGSREADASGGSTHRPWSRGVSTDQSGGMTHEPARGQPSGVGEADMSERQIYRWKRHRPPRRASPGPIYRPVRHLSGDPHRRIQLGEDRSGFWRPRTSCGRDSDHGRISEGPRRSGGPSVLPDSLIARASFTHGFPYYPNPNLPMALRPVVNRCANSPMRIDRLFPLDKGFRGLDSFIKQSACGTVRPLARSPR
jgi:hypothetical protein